MTQIRHVQVEVSSLQNTLAEKIGQSLQPCSCLEDVTLCVGEGSTTKQVLKFQDTQLHLDSVSEEFVTIFLELSPILLEEV